MANNDRICIAGIPLTEKGMAIERDVREYVGCPLNPTSLDCDACRNLFEENGFGDNYEDIVAIHGLLRKMIGIRREALDYEGDSISFLTGLYEQMIQQRRLLADFDYPFTGLDQLMGLRNWKMEEKYRST